MSETQWAILGAISGSIAGAVVGLILLWCLTQLMNERYDRLDGV